ncbi:MAG TPA: hypothetical protein V6D18_14930 [Thermosynechococcaceae cyanobacterium]
MPTRRSEFVKTLEAGAFALSLIGLCLVQSTPQLLSQSASASNTGTIVTPLP